LRAKHLNPKSVPSALRRFSDNKFCAWRQALSDSKVWSLDEVYL